MPSRTPVARGLFRGSGIALLYIRRRFGAEARARLSFLGSGEQPGSGAEQTQMPRLAPSLECG